MKEIKFLVNTEIDTNSFFNTFDENLWHEHYPKHDSVSPVPNGTMVDVVFNGEDSSVRILHSLTEDCDWTNKPPSEYWITGWRLSEKLTKHSDEEVVQKEHSHYFKSVKHLNYIDVYRTLSLFNVTDPCLQHCIKKLLVAGGRGAGKDIAQDIKEAIDSLERWKEMRNEDSQI